MWHAAKDVNVYANWGEGFEPPTFIERAYRDAGTGLNFNLRPAVSRSAEAGIKAYVLNRQRVNLAVFSTTTSDEIVIDTAGGGRTAYKNASKNPPPPGPPQCAPHLAYRLSPPPPLPR